MICTLMDPPKKSLKVILIIILHCRLKICKHNTLNIFAIRTPNYHITREIPNTKFNYAETSKQQEFALMDQNANMHTDNLSSDSII